MMKIVSMIAALSVFAGSSVAAATAQPTPFGLWQNPKATIIVRAHSCGELLCGTIIWAAPEAISDARDAGVTTLVGTNLLSDYHPNGRGRWAGKVYVPDEGRRFSSTIELKDPNHLRISGCILGGLICKHQIWVRR